MRKIMNSKVLKNNSYYYFWFM